MTHDAATTSDLDASLIEQRLATAGAHLGRPLSVVAATASTNDDAKQAARNGAPHGAAFIADRQTAGRGRLGRTWHSPPGENLYASFVLRLPLEVERVPTVALAAGLAIADVVGALIEPGRARPLKGRVAIKWPNDVWIDGRKVAGILIEASSSGARVDAVVLGIGINVRSVDFPPDLANRATSIALALSGQSRSPAFQYRGPDRSAIFLALCRALHARVDRLVAEGVAAIHQDLVWLDGLAGKAIRVDGADALALGIDANGALAVRDANGAERTYVAGDVTLAL